jgi:hypothetical protein
VTELEGSSFSEEKEAKRLYFVRRAAVNQRAPKRVKVFPAYQPSNTGLYKALF